MVFILTSWTDEGREETGVPAEVPNQQASDTAAFWSPKIQAPTETQMYFHILVADAC